MVIQTPEQKVQQQVTQNMPQQQNNSKPEVENKQVEELQNKIKELEKANLALLNQTTVQKQPSFDECVYNIYKAERGIKDGNN